MFTIVFILSAVATSAFAADAHVPGTSVVTNLNRDQIIHEDLMASQELITLGCMGKLKIAPEASGNYDPASLARLQECADNEGTDLAGKILAEYKRGELDKSRMQIFTLHYAVVFAKANNPEAEKLTTADLIKAAREQGKRHHPYSARP